MSDDPIPFPAQRVNHGALPPRRPPARRAPHATIDPELVNVPAPGDVSLLVAVLARLVISIAQAEHMPDRKAA